MIHAGDGGRTVCYHIPMSLFDRILTQPIFNLLAFIYGFVGDFGVAIIILTIIVRLCLWPLVKRQLRQAQIMREIQPELARIKKEANGNTMLESTMLVQLYKDKDIHPFSSILVVLIQLPIFIAIFRVIRVFSDPNYNTVNGTAAADFIYPFLQNFGDVPRLIAGSHLTFGPIDLAQTPGKYTPALIIAIVAATLQLVQTYLSMPHGKNTRGVRDIMRDAANGKEVSQTEMMMATNRRMMFFTPLLTFVVALALPGAVVLYYAATAGVGIVQQLIVRRLYSGKAGEQKAQSENEKRAKRAKKAVVVETGHKPPKTDSGKKVVRRVKAGK